MLFPRWRRDRSWTRKCYIFIRSANISTAVWIGWCVNRIILPLNRIQKTLQINFAYPRILLISCWPSCGIPAKQETLSVAAWIISSPRIQLPLWTCAGAWMNFQVRSVSPKMMKKWILLQNISWDVPGAGFKRYSWQHSQKKSNFEKQRNRRWMNYLIDIQCLQLPSGCSIQSGLGGVSRKKLLCLKNSPKNGRQAL